MEELLEYYIEDYIIFESILERDYYSLINIIANEGYRNNRTQQSEEEEKNKILGKAIIYETKEKILKAIDTIKEKVNQLINKLITILDEKELKKWTNKVEENKDLLLKTDFKDFRIEDNCPDEASIADLRAKIINIGNITNDFENGAVKITDDMINELKEKIKNIKDDRKKTHEDIWWIKSTDYKHICDPYFLLKQFEDEKKTYRATQKLKKDVAKSHENIKRELQKSKFLYLDMTDREAIKQMNRNIRYVNLHGTYIINTIKTLIIEQKNVSNWYKKCLISLLGYAKKQSKSSNNESYIGNEYINAVAETVIYELDCEV